MSTLLNKVARSQPPINQTQFVLELIFLTLAVLLTFEFTNPMKSVISILPLFREFILMLHDLWTVERMRSIIPLVVSLVTSIFFLLYFGLYVELSIFAVSFILSARLRRYRQTIRFIEVLLLYSFPRILDFISQKYFKKRLFVDIFEFEPKSTTRSVVAQSELLVTDPVSPRILISLTSIVLIALSGLIIDLLKISIDKEISLLRRHNRLDFLMKEITDVYVKVYDNKEVFGKLLICCFLLVSCFIEDPWRYGMALVGLSTIYLRWYRS
jgi:hypothetical protein